MYMKMRATHVLFFPIFFDLHYVRCNKATKDRSSETNHKVRKQKNKTGIFGKLSVGKRTCTAKLIIRRQNMRLCYPSRAHTQI